MGHSRSPHTTAHQLTQLVSTLLHGQPVSVTNSTVHSMYNSTDRAGAHSRSPITCCAPTNLSLHNSLAPLVKLCDRVSHQITLQPPMPPPTPPRHPPPLPVGTRLQLSPQPLYFHFPPFHWLGCSLHASTFSHIFPQAQRPPPTRTTKPLCPTCPCATALNHGPNCVTGSPASSPSYTPTPFRASFLRCALRSSPCSKYATPPPPIAFQGTPTPLYTHTNALSKSADTPVPAPRP